jgi:hypothetical protein
MTKSVYSRFDPEKVIDLSPSYSGEGGPPGGDLEARVKKLEDEIVELRKDLRTLLVDSAEVKTSLKSIATKADVESIKTQLSDRVGPVEGQIKHMLTFWQFLIVMSGLLALVLRWPELFRLARASIGAP